MTRWGRRCPDNGALTPSVHRATEGEVLAQRRATAPANHKTRVRESAILRRPSASRKSHTSAQTDYPHREKASDAGLPAAPTCLHTTRSMTLLSAGRWNSTTPPSIAHAHAQFCHRLIPLHHPAMLMRTPWSFGLSKLAFRINALSAQTWTAWTACAKRN